MYSGNSILGMPNPKLIVLSGFQMPERKVNYNGIITNFSQIVNFFPHLIYTFSQRIRYILIQKWIKHQPRHQKY